MNKFDYTIQERNKDARLCKAYRSGDEEAFVMMCERYNRVSFRHAIAWIKDECSASGLDTKCLDDEDVIQEAQIALMIRMRDPKVYKQIESGDFKLMVYESAFNAIYEYLYRNGLLNKTIPVPDDNFETFYDDPFDIIEKEMLLNAVRESLDVLSQREFAIFNGRLKGKTRKELASYYNVTIERIRQIDQKAQRKMRRRMMSYNYSMNPNSYYKTRTKRDKLNSSISDMYQSKSSFKDMITPVLLPKYIHPECLMDVNIKEYHLPAYSAHEHEWNNKEFVESVMKSLNDFTVLVYQKIGLKIVSNDDDGVRVILPYTLNFKPSNENRNSEIVDRCDDVLISINESQTFMNFTCPYDSHFALVRINNAYVQYTFSSFYLKSIYF